MAVKRVFSGAFPALNLSTRGHVTFVYVYCRSLCYCCFWQLNHCKWYVMALCCSDDLKNLKCASYNDVFGAS